MSAGKINTKHENAIKELFKDVQSVLKSIQVRNPFAEQLKIPDYVFKPLRTNSHYLAFIETVTFYNQYQREIKIDKSTGENFIETNLEDIELTNRLLKDVLLAKSDELSGECRKLFERIKHWLKEQKRESFITKEIREEFRMNPYNLKYYISELNRYGYIKTIGGNRYKSGFEYQILNFDEYDNLNNHVISAFDVCLQKIKGLSG